MQWGFYQCEPDVWIVLAVDTQISSIEQGGSVSYYKHSPSGEGLVQAIEVYIYPLRCDLSRMLIVLHCIQLSACKKHHV